MEKQVFQYAQLNHLDLVLTFYSRKKKTLNKATILDLHGGGLLYGNRDDLAEEVIDFF